MTIQVKHNINKNTFKKLDFIPKKWHSSKYNIALQLP